MLRACLILGFIIPIFASAMSAETNSWPLWNDVETIEQYAAKVNLPVATTIELAPAVSMRVRLIPAAKFTMGVKKPVAPTPPVIPPQLILIAGLSAMAALLAQITIKSIRHGRRLQCSLYQFVLVTLALAVSIGGAVKNYQNKQVQLAYEQELARYTAAKDDEKPARIVTITKPFYIGECNVTQEQYQSILGNNPSVFKGPKRPVETVTWKKAVQFCEKVSEQSGRRVRLPSEAEWELAAGAGGTAHFVSGNGEADLDRVAWYSANSNRATHDVGSKDPNAFGLYDMLGNVFQWCADEGVVSYADLPENDPLAKGRHSNPYGSFYDMRGGSWYSGPNECRVTNRAAAVPEIELEYIGFRVVVEVDRP